MKDTQFSDEVSSTMKAENVSGVLLGYGIGLMTAAVVIILNLILFV